LAGASLVNYSDRWYGGVPASIAKDSSRILNLNNFRLRFEDIPTVFEGKTGFCIKQLKTLKQILKILSSV